MSSDSHFREEQRIERKTPCALVFSPLSDACTVSLPFSVFLPRERLIDREKNKCYYRRVPKHEVENNVINASR